MFKAIAARSSAPTNDVYTDRMTTPITSSPTPAISAVILVDFFITLTSKGTYSLPLADIVLFACVFSVCVLFACVFFICI